MLATANNDRTAIVTATSPISDGRAPIDTAFRRGDQLGRPQNASAANELMEIEVISDWTQDFWVCVVHMDMAWHPAPQTVRVVDNSATSHGRKSAPKWTISDAHCVHLT